MKKILKISLVIGLFFLAGCGITNDSNIIEKLTDKLEKSNSYYVSGEMEIINNEDTYTYDVEVSYQKGDYYKVRLVNELNNHEQVILRNDDGVYVITPSLNKSYKFQSDWPYNNSQVYLLSSVYDDLNGDEDRTVKDTDNGYLFSSLVNYPNNKSLVKQNVYIDKKLNVTKVEVVDNDNNVQISMIYNEIEFDKKFDDDDFELSSVLGINNGNNNVEIGDNNTDNSENDESETKTTATIDDIIYPMYLPNNTYLANQQTIDTDDGQRLILTFDGDSSFVLVEETVSYDENGLVIPMSGDIEFLTDVVGVVGDNSVTWNSNGIEYYIVSDTIPTSELVEIAQSISVLPVSK